MGTFATVLFEISLILHQARWQKNKSQYRSYANIPKIKPQCITLPNLQKNTWKLTLHLEFLTHKYSCAHLAWHRATHSRPCCRSETMLDATDYDRNFRTFRESGGGTSRLWMTYKFPGIHEGVSCNYCDSFATSKPTDPSVDEAIAGQAGSRRYNSITFLVGSVDKRPRSSTIARSPLVV